MCHLYYIRLNHDVIANGSWHGCSLTFNRNLVISLSKFYHDNYRTLLLFTNITYNLDFLMIQMLTLYHNNWYDMIVVFNHIYSLKKKSNISYIELYIFTGLDLQVKFVGDMRFNWLYLSHLASFWYILVVNGEPICDLQRNKTS